MSPSSGNSMRSTSPEPVKVPDEYSGIEMGDLKQIATLGMGGFGRVELIQLRTDKTKSFALKCLKKKHIVDTKQQDHIISEKNLLLECKTIFVTRFGNTYSQYLTFIFNDSVSIFYSFKFDNKKVVMKHDF